MLTIIAFIIILSLLVFVHEFGHFITAKKSGMKVEEFGFGFPPRLWGKEFKGTIYSINWIPLGGFVKIKGENGEDRQEADSFSYQSFWKKGLVLSAGVIMNIILAVIIFAFGFMAGIPASVSQSDIENNRVEDLKVQVASVLEGSPAQTAGLKAGDQVVRAGDRQIETIQDLQGFVNSNQDQPFELEVISLRGQARNLTVEPAYIEGFAEQKVLGVQLLQTGLVSYGFFESLKNGFVYTFQMLWAIILAFYGLFKNLIIGQGLSGDLSGPVGVAIVTGRMVELGWSYIFHFTAVLSLNLAVLNFLPFPALDGGRFLFLVIEKLRGKPNNQQVENAVHGAGFTLLIILVIFITYRDVARYGGVILDKLKDVF